LTEGVFLSETLEENELSIEREELERFLVREELGSLGIVGEKVGL